MADDFDLHIQLDQQPTLHRRGVAPGFSYPSAYWPSLLAHLPTFGSMMTVWSKQFRRLRSRPLCEWSRVMKKP